MVCCVRLCLIVFPPGFTIDKKSPVEYKVYADQCGSFWLNTGSVDRKAIILGIR